MIHDFDTIPISDEKKPRVGIVGEILVKFLPAANNHLAELLEAEGAEGARLGEAACESSADAAACSGGYNTTTAD